MGEVYEVEDGELGGRVALKTLRGGPIDAVALERFRREILLGRKVTHPAVCRVFDVGYQDRAEGVRLAFVTMELLRGQPLSRRLERGALTPVEALPLIEQLASGLDAAHRAGIVHRDLKSDNIMLVPDAGVAGGQRAVIMDFGLARPAQPDHQPQVTQVGEIIGSPHYMAPEQVTGGTVGPAADVFAFGVVIYEMLTGRLPFEGNSFAEVAYRRVAERPIPPRRHLPSLERRWEAVILHCLERDPAQRLASAGQVYAALTAPGNHSIATAAGRRRGRRLRIVAAAAALMVLVGGGLALSIRWIRHRNRGLATRTATLRHSLAVLPLIDDGGREDKTWIGAAVAELLRAELAAGGRLRVLSSADMVHESLDLGAHESGRLASSAISDLRPRLGSDYVVSGAYLALPGDRLRLELQLIDARSNRIIAELAETGGEGDLLELVGGVSIRLRRAIGLAPPADAQTARARATLPTDGVARRFYAQGLERLWRMEGAAARQALEHAATLEPGHPLIQSALGEAYRMIGDDRKAVEAGRRALEHAGSLGREDQLLIEGRYYEAVPDWKRAVEAYEALAKLAPDRTDYAVMEANAEVRAHKLDDASHTLRRLRELSNSVADDVNADMVEARIDMRRSEFAHLKQLLEGTARKAHDAGLRGIEAEALRGMGLARFQLEGAGTGVAELEAARSVYIAIGNRSGLAATINDLAVFEFEQGRSQTALQRFQEALDISRALGDRRSTALGLHNVAGGLSERGDWAGSRAAYEEALDIRRELDDRPGMAETTGQLGVLAEDEGNLALARDRLTEAARRFRELDQRDRVAGMESALCEVLLDQDERVEARRACEESVTIRDELHLADWVAFSRAQLAMVDLADGRQEAAEQGVRRTIAGLSDSNSANSRIFTWLTFIEIMLARQKNAEALHAAEQVHAMVQTPDHVTFRLRSDLMLARAQVAERHSPEGLRTLRSLAETARHRQGISLSFKLDTTMALGLAELTLGHVGAGRARLEALEREATTHGYRLLARQARQARAQQGRSQRAFAR
jgi:tetratricopeptide (TPR) repeat protein/TolB-like protein